MSRPGFPTHIALAGLLAGGGVAAADRIDAPVVLLIDWEAGERGTASLRDAISRSAFDALTARGCFGEVLEGGGNPDADLRLVVELGDLREETIYDDSLSEQANPTRPDQSLRVTAVFSLFVRWELFGPTAGQAIEGRRFKVERRRRPTMAGEDPSVRARDEAVDTIGRELARAVCRVSRRKVASSIAGAER